MFCNRTLNMRSVQVVGFDMDYTLVHYDVMAWEERAYAHARQRLLRENIPVDGLAFDPSLFARGLVIDLALGNIVKANRFGYVTQASHGTQHYSYEALREAYSEVWVDLSEPRWIFLNTLFSLSEACLYAQMVDLLDAGALESHDYGTLYALVSRGIDAAHLEGELKAEILADPDRFVELDADLPRALLDLRQAGKKLFLATNSEWHYTVPMMHYVFDRYLDDGVDWRSLFDLVIVQAKKPGFFDGNRSFDVIVDERGSSEPHDAPLTSTEIFKGGNSKLVQEHFGVAGSNILYVGDHAYADVHVSSRIQRWRTMLVLRELEHEVREESAFGDKQAELVRLMARKEELDHEQAILRLALLRLAHGADVPRGYEADATTLRERLRKLRPELAALDREITPLAIASSRLGHEHWGLLMRAGNDKSRLAREIEGFADVYTSRVSNFLYLSPFAYLRAVRGSLPHDAFLQ